jgi:hypothetical protein
MKNKPLIVALAGFSLIATPAWADMKASRDAPAGAGAVDCKSLVATKHVKNGDVQAEMEKCLNNPAAYH